MDVKDVVMSKEAGELIAVLEGYEFEPIQVVVNDDMTQNIIAEN